MSDEKKPADLNEIKAQIVIVKSWILGIKKFCRFFNSRDLFRTKHLFNQCFCPSSLDLNSNNHPSFFGDNINFAEM